ncbi:hypothetical protein protein, putative [Babesia ovis]|uniref:Secreted protein n=1 Tax=Babesia ovis TaxID=5869 RepID=A0A9W5TCS9_BABOV|nr:hypothetical protein protein, putative [Babesia ovis]
MKYTKTVIVSSLSLMIAIIKGGDEPSVVAPQDKQDAGSTFTGLEAHGAHSTDAASEGEVEDPEVDLEEEIPVTGERKRIVQALEFCLKKGDLTPMELVNCTSDLLHYGNLNPPTAFEKCIGDYVTATTGACIAKIAELQDGEDYAEAFTKTRFDNIGFILGNFIVKAGTRIATSTKGDMLERATVIGDCLPMLLRNLFGIQEFSFSCRKLIPIDGYDDPDDDDFDEADPDEE